MQNHSVFLSDILQGKKHLSFTKFFSALLKTNGINPRFIIDTNDIWLRDFMPIQIAPGEFAQFTLTNDYYLKKDRHKWTDPGPICKSLGINLTPISNNGNPVYLDGGNVVRGNGKAIITEKVFRDDSIERDILKRILLEALKVDQIIFIPVESGDETGHADGMVRWVNEHTIVANDYSRTVVAQNFRDRFYNTLSSGGLDVLRVPYYPSDERINGYQSASGCYINFLQVGNRIFLPAFDEPDQDNEAIQRFGEIFGARNIIPVPSREIARGGGVLNCLSWEIVD